MNEQGHISGERLSAYHDGELVRSEAADVQAHLAQCRDCRGRAENLKQLTGVTARLPDPTPTRDLWPGIEAAIGSRQRTPSIMAALVHTQTRRIVAVAMIVAVVVGGLVVVGPLNDAFRAPAETAGVFGFDYGAFLTGLNEPAKMERFDRKYQRRQISIDEALSIADVSVDRKLLERIPEGLDFHSVYVLSSEAARAVQVTYRHNGSEIAVFRQAQGLPVRFAGYEIEPAAIGSKMCLMVDVGRYCAITFSSDDAQYVVIGRNDDMKVAQVIDELLASL